MNYHLGSVIFFGFATISIIIGLTDHAVCNMLAAIYLKMHDKT